MTADTSADFVALYQAHYHDVLLVMRGYLLPMDAEDAAQEVWLRAWSHWPPPHEEQRAWLFRITHNVLVDTMRRRGVQARRVLPMEYEYPEEADRDFVTNGMEDATLDALDTAARWDTLQSALATLPPRQQDALWLWADSVPFVDAGRSLGVNANAYKAILHRGRVNLWRAVHR